MNTGLSLRRMGETSYGRYRRFVLANPIMTPFCLSNISKIDIASAEKQFCARQKINYIEPSNVVKPFKDSLIRACDACFQSGYHSKYFACLWLTHCPLHGREISETCSECAQAWPTESEMLTRDCKICGRSTRLTELKRVNAFDRDLLNRNINTLIELENLYNSGHFWDSYSSFGSDDTSNWHRSDTFYSATTSSTLLGFFPHAAKLFRSLNICDTEPCLLCSFDIGESPSLSTWSRNLEGSVDCAVNSISNAIYRSLLKRSNNFCVIDTQSLKKDLRQLKLTYSVDSIAYSMWRLIVAPKSRMTFKQSVLRRISREYRYLVPTPMTMFGRQGTTQDQIGNSKYSYFNPWTEAQSIVYPPLNLIELIYKIDLVTCFKAVHNFLDLHSTAEELPFTGVRSIQECYSGNILIMLNAQGKKNIEIAFLASALKL